MGKSRFLNALRTRREMRRAMRMAGYHNFGQYSQNKIGPLQLVIKNLTGAAQPISLFKDVDASKVQITNAGGSYSGLIREIIANPMEITNFQVSASSSSQMNQPMQFMWRDPLGNFQGTTVIPATLKSMYQKVPNQVDTLNRKMYLSQDTSIDFTLLPNQELILVMKIGKIADKTKQLNSIAA